MPAPRGHPEDPPPATPAHGSGRPLDENVDEAILNAALMGSFPERVVGTSWPGFARR